MRAGFQNPTDMSATQYVPPWVSQGLVAVRPPRHSPPTVHVTAHPTAAWVWRQMIEATPWGQHPKYLIHDRDRVYRADFAARVAGLGIESIRTPIQAPRANAIAERVVRGIVLEH